jgi:hypothetical protein
VVAPAAHRRFCGVGSADAVIPSRTCSTGPARRSVYDIDGSEQPTCQDWAYSPVHTATGSTSIVPPQDGQRDSRAGAEAPSLERPQAMQYTRKTMRAALRAAARSSAEGSSVSSNEVRSQPRDRALAPSVADSAIMRQSLPTIDGGILPAVAGGVSGDNSTPIEFPESYAAGPDETATRTLMCLPSAKAPSLGRELPTVYAPCFGPAAHM